MAQSATRQIGGLGRAALEFGQPVEGRALFDEDLLGQQLVLQTVQLVHIAESVLQRLPDLFISGLSSRNGQQSLRYAVRQLGISSSLIDFPTHILRIGRVRKSYLDVDHGPEGQHQGGDRLHVVHRTDSDLNRPEFVFLFLFPPWPFIVFTSTITFFHTVGYTAVQVSNIYGTECSDDTTIRQCQAETHWVPRNGFIKMDR